MIYLNNFDTHASYEEKLNVGGIDFKIPNVSYCNDVKDVHFNPYNLIKFYVGEITQPQTVKIYTDAANHLDVTVSKGSKWYSYLLPKNKGLYKIGGNSVKKVVVKADINNYSQYIIPNSVVEASFKGSNTSNVTNMESMFVNCYSLTSLNLRSFNTSNVTSMEWMFMACSGLESLDLNGWNTSKVTNMGYMFSGCTSLTSLDLSGWNTSKVTFATSMFEGCTNLKTIKMIGCEQLTIDKIKAQLTKDNITGVTINP